MTGVVDAAEKVSTHVVTALPSQFLALVLINTMFVLGLLWFLHDFNKDRIAAFREFAVACTTALHESMPAHVDH